MPSKKQKLPLSVTHPELAKEADGWDPGIYTYGSMKSVPWICRIGHKWTSTINHRAIRGDGCPYCSGKKVQTGFNDLATTDIAIAREASGWNPAEYSRGSHKKMEWRCAFGHTWIAVIKNRTLGKSGCPVCSNDKIQPGYNDLATTHPELAKEAFEWNPSDFGAGHNSKKNWQCNIGHIWSASLNTRTNLNSGCPVCDGKKILKGFNDLKTLFPILAQEASGWDPSIISPGTHKKHLWKCSSGHEWVASPHERTRKQSRGCPSCSKFGYSPTNDGYLYFLEHPTWDMYQVGITNKPVNRLKDHTRLGWELLELRGPMDGYLTEQWESAILRMLKGKGADLSNERIAGKFDGYSEAWSKSTFEVKSIKELMQLTEEFEEK